MNEDTRLTPEQMESLKRGIADALAGRVKPLSDVLAEMGIEASEQQMREDMDAAIAISRTWPLLELPGNAVEIRPMVEDYSHLEE